MVARILAAAALALLALTAPAAADEAQNITVTEAWSRATAPSQKNGAVFLTIRNDGGTADRLVAAASPVAGRAELHAHSMDGGIMRMRPVEAIEVPANDSVTLAPGRLHVMLTGLSTPLAVGDFVPLTLTFEHAGTIAVEATVMGAGAHGGDAYAPHKDGDGHGHGGSMMMDGHGDMGR